MAETARQWKILDLVKTTEKLFTERSVPNARLGAELLLARALGTERIRLYLDFEKPVSEAELEQFRKMVKRRLSCEPLQYILGEAHFYGLKFTVDSSVLIPRPETELLVELVLGKIADKGLKKPRILEIGTGSGCIPISIACNADCEIDATDIDEHAIQIARSNLTRNKGTGMVNFIRQDFFSAGIEPGRYDMVISNPPYIPLIEVEQLPEEIRNFEPKHALTDNLDGLEFYRKIFTLYSSLPVKPIVLLEIGDGKKDSVEELVKKSGIQNYMFHKDLMGIFRVIEL